MKKLSKTLEGIRDKKAEEARGNSLREMLFELGVQLDNIKGMYVNAILQLNNQVEALKKENEALKAK